MPGSTSQTGVRGVLFRELVPHYMQSFIVAVDTKGLTSIERTVLSQQTEVWAKVCGDHLSTHFS